MNQTRHSPTIDRSAESRQTLMFSTANDLPEGTRQEVVRALNRNLADTTDLMTQMKTAHWNVKGIHFYQLHLLFDEIAELLEGHADMLAERATALGGQAKGTVRVAANESRVPELDPSAVTGEEFLQATVENLAVHAANLRADIDYAAGCGDEGTADLYTELSRQVDQQLYFLESHLQTQPIDTIERSETPRATEPARSTSVGPDQQTGGTTAHPDSAQPVGQPSGQPQPPQRVTFTGPGGQGQTGPGTY